MSSLLSSLNSLISSSNFLPGVRHVASRIPLRALSFLQLPLSSPFVAVCGPSCPRDSPLSCHNSSVVSDLCCFNFPGGQLLQTQFWDYNPATGPTNSWTIHGLWPDHCDGSYDQYCDDSRRFTNISDIIKAAGNSELLDVMKQYWKDYQGDDENLWEHEWAKHGTCISTLKTTCYESYTPQQEVVDYFSRTVGLFHSLDTYQTLAQAGIEPSAERTWTFAELSTPLAKAHGANVTLGCRGNSLGEVWYHFDIRGSVQTGEFVPSQPDGTKGSCPQGGIRYLPKQASPTSTLPPSTTIMPTPTATSQPFTGSGYLAVRVGGLQQGCLISFGEWYTSGTCATYHAQTDASEALDVAHSFTLTSSKGPCSFLDGIFRCGADNATQSIFSNEESELSFKQRTVFYAEDIPGRGVKGNIFSDKTASAMELSIEWVSK